MEVKREGKQRLLSKIELWLAFYGFRNGCHVDAFYRFAGFLAKLGTRVLLTYISMICSEYEGGHAIQRDGCRLAPRESEAEAASNGRSIVLKYLNVSIVWSFFIMGI